MTLLERIHGSYVHRRRIAALSGHIAEIIPDRATVLDVGAGDGLLAAEVARRSPGIEIQGIDVLVRDRTNIPVDLFDGKAIPRGRDAVDVVLLIDVLHHADQPARLLDEAVRVARRAIVVKDHLLEGLGADWILRFMDRVSNRRHGVSLPHNYWSRDEWRRAFAALPGTVEVWKQDLHIYPLPASLVFDRSLHFLARLDLDAAATPWKPSGGVAEVGQPAEPDSVEGRRATAQSEAPSGRSKRSITRRTGTTLS